VQERFNAGRENAALRSVRAKRELDEAGKALTLKFWHILIYGFDR
jgi:hypothetical protein